jgi:hypothetical protein
VNTTSDAHLEVPVANQESRGGPKRGPKRRRAPKPGFVIANFLAHSVKCTSLNKLRFDFALLNFKLT